MLVAVVCVAVIVVVIRSLQADSALLQHPPALPSTRPAKGTITDGTGSNVQIVQDAVFQTQVQKMRGDRKQQIKERDRKIIHDELEKAVSQQISQRKNDKLTQMQPLEELDRMKSAHTPGAILIADYHPGQTARPDEKSTSTLTEQDRQKQLNNVAIAGDKAALAGSHSEYEGSVTKQNDSNKDVESENALVDVQTS
jgi:hypothetical protein